MRSSLTLPIIVTAFEAAGPSTRLREEFWPATATESMQVRQRIAKGFISAPLQTPHGRRFFGHHGNESRPAAQIQSIYCRYQEFLCGPPVLPNESYSLILPLTETATKRFV